MLCTAHKIICSVVQCYYPTDNVMYRTDSLMYRNDNVMYRTENVIYLTRMLCTNAMYQTDLSTYPGAGASL